jgi:hypothetical protein
VHGLEWPKAYDGMPDHLVQADSHRIEMALASVGRSDASIDAMESRRVHEGQGRRDASEERRRGGETQEGLIG